MGNELLDFKQQDNFDFFKFSTYYGKGDGNSKEAQEKLKRDCNGVLEYVHAMDNDMCLLSYRLLELKQSGTWQNVINPETGCSFWNHTFDDFCFYAFGFSKTRTSNHLRIAQFVQLTGGKAGFIDKRYEGFSRSQLVELAPVPPSNRHYFNRKMTVSEMRTVKDYMKMGGFFQDKFEEGFEVLSYAKAWKERKSLPSAPQSLPADVIPGQIDLSEMEEIVEVDEPSETPQENPTSDFATVRQEDEPSEETELENPISDFEKAREEVELSNEAEGFVEENELSSDSERYGEEKKTWRDDFKTRDGAREFLNDYRNWEDRSNYRNHFFEMVYVYQFRNGMLLWACERKIYNCSDIVFGSSETEVVYYLQAFRGDGQAEISKRQLERFFATYKDEL